MVLERRKGSARKGFQGAAEIHLPLGPRAGRPTCTWPLVREEHGTNAAPATCGMSMSMHALMVVETELGRDDLCCARAGGPHASDMRCRVVAFAARQQLVGQARPGLPLALLT